MPAFRMVHTDTIEGPVVVRGHPGYVPEFPNIFICNFMAKRILLLALRSWHMAHSDRSVVKGLPAAADRRSASVWGKGSVSPRLRADRQSTFYLVSSLRYWVIISQVGIDQTRSVPLKLQKSLRTGVLALEIFNTLLLYNSRWWVNVNSRSILLGVAPGCAQ